MVAEAFYTELAEARKAGFYVALFAVIGLAFARARRRGDDSWIPWLHGTIMFHWIVGGLYSGIRMLTQTRSPTWPCAARLPSRPSSASQS